MQSNKIDFIRENFYNTWEWAVKNDLHNNSSGLIPPNKEEAFQILYESDPTYNKKYLDWVRCLHKYNLKQYKSHIRGYENTYTHTFWEDVSVKIHPALELYHFLKKTKVIEIKDREISRFKTLHDFIVFMHWFQVKVSGGGKLDDAEIITLNHREISAITNYYETTHNKQIDKGCGLAEIVYDGDLWLVVKTYNYKANVEFGKYTTWCTSIRETTFNNYNSRGCLFILIKKGFGSSASIKQQPDVRLQFHFEDEMYMDALDNRIDVFKFFSKHNDIKEFFKPYVINNVIPSRSSKSSSDNILLLLNLGYGGEIIGILKKTRPRKLNLQSFNIDNSVIEHLGDVVSLEEINLSHNNIQKIPSSFRNLHKLVKLNLSVNKIKEIPDWLMDLPNLSVLDVSSCDISNFYISNQSKISKLLLNNNPNLTQLPNRLDLMPNLTQLNISDCNITKISDDILNCKNLWILDVNNNPNLIYIPTQISTLPNIIAIVLDDTKITDEDIQLMHEIKTRNVTIIKYNKN